MVVYILITIAMFWYVGRPLNPPAPPEPQDDSKAWAEIINLVIACTTLFWVLVVIVLWNR